MSVPAVAIIDSGGANIASLLYALARSKVRAQLTTDPEIIQGADRVILPGVGAAGDAMQRLREHGLIDVIRQLQQPVLGICLGMQLLADASEEEDVECLGIIPGTARLLHADRHWPVPNMGWCRVRQGRDHEILANVDDDAWFYFVHSYALPVGDYTLATASHREPFSAMVNHRNFVAAQFHPERSAASGSVLLGNFVANDQ